VDSPPLAVVTDLQSDHQNRRSTPLTYEELWNYFQLIRARFGQAKSLEEKQKLVALSQEVIRRAEAQLLQHAANARP
jgi:excinuclease UvrABC ATPase subunit